MMNKPHQLPYGHRLGRYVVRQVIGEGGFGIIYQAEVADVKPTLASALAIKEYYPRGFAARGHDGMSIYSTYDDTYFHAGLALFGQEAQRMRQADHPHVVRLLDTFDANQTRYIVMPLYTGPLLSEWLEACAPAPDHIALELLTPICEGIHSLHVATDKTPLLHRDIKPHNIILTLASAQTPSFQAGHYPLSVLAALQPFQLHPILIDFGAAYPFTHSSVTHTQHTRTVSEGYAPLEQYHRHAPEGPFTDVYGCGAVLYHMLLGYAPTPALERHLTLRQNQPDPLQIPRTLVPAWAKVLTQALALDPQQRYQSMPELLAACTRAAHPLQRFTFAHYMPPSRAQTQSTPLSPTVHQIHHPHPPTVFDTTFNTNPLPKRRFVALLVLLAVLLGGLGVWWAVEESAAPSFVGEGVLSSGDEWGLEQPPQLPLLSLPEREASPLNPSEEAQASTVETEPQPVLQEVPADQGKMALNPPKEKEKQPEVPIAPVTIHVEDLSALPSLWISLFTPEDLRALSRGLHPSDGAAPFGVQPEIATLPLLRVPEASSVEMPDEPPLSEPPSPEALLSEVALTNEDAAPPVWRFVTLGTDEPATNREGTPARVEAAPNPHDLSQVAPEVLLSPLNQIVDVALSPDTRLLAVANRRTHLVLWDLQASPPQAYSLPANSRSGTMISVAFSPVITEDQHTRKYQLVTGAQESVLSVWEVRAVERQGLHLSASWQHHLNTARHHGPIIQVAFAPYSLGDEVTLASASQNAGEVYVWTLPSQTVKTLQHGSVAISALAFHPTLPWLTSGSTRDGVALWPLPEQTADEPFNTLKQTLTHMHTDSDMLSGVQALAFSPLGTWLAVSVNGATHDARFYLYDLTHSQTAFQTVPLASEALDLYFSSDTQLVSAHRNGNLQVWHLTSGTAPALVSTLQAEDTKRSVGLVGYSYAPSDREETKELVISAYRDGRLIRWRVPSSE